MLHPGRRGAGGPDFQGALLDFAGERRRGDVELHREEQDWWRHGHHRDPRYNGVILHVVEKGWGSVPLASGGQALTLPLGAGLGQGCPGAGRPQGEIIRLLDEAGETWFAGKVARLRQELRQQDGGQALYQGLAEALGYAENRGPFRELARALPLSRCEEGLRGHPKPPLFCQALLLGRAGLLLSQRGRQPAAPWELALEAAWRAWGWGEPLGFGAWRFGRVRPANYPTRRLAALAHLLAWGWVRRAPALPLKPKELEGSLLVRDEGYWLGHWDLGRPARRPSPVLLGPGRARTIIVNVLLPWGAAQGSREAREAFGRYPPLEGNAVTCTSPFAARLTSAQRQQGWLYIERAFCQEGACPACPLAG